MLNCHSNLLSLERLVLWLEDVTKQRYVLTPMNLSTLAISYLCLGRITRDEHYYQRGLHSIQKILREQNADGSWNETYPSIKVKSTLATAYVGFVLLRSTNLTDIELFSILEKPLSKASHYVISNEIAPGRFLKSEFNSNDTVNVNLVCSLFLLYLHKYTGDYEFFKISSRTVKRVIKNQLESGVFPYYTDKKSYLTPLVYHAFITRLEAEYFLLAPEEYVRTSLIEAATWLANKFNAEGKLNWSGELGDWVYRSFSTYGYALHALLLMSTLIDERFKQLPQRILDYILNRRLLDESFPELDSDKTSEGILVDIENIFRPISHREFSGTLSLSMKMLKRTLSDASLGKVTANIQLLEALASSCEFLQNMVARLEK